MDIEAPCTRRRSPSTCIRQNTRKLGVRVSSIYHNPNAREPLSVEAFPCAAHHTARDGRILSQVPAFFPIGSATVVSQV